MFRYYQCGDKGPWTPLPVPKGKASGAAVEAQAAMLGATKLTILAVSEVFNTDAGEGYDYRSGVSYKGPMYFDIDHADGLAAAIVSTQELVRKLQENGMSPGQYQIFASGSKGFHVIIPETVFSSGRASRNLPDVYMVMARHLYVSGVDFAVYCSGRGNSFRLPNGRRDDGRYRTPITDEELRNITPETYLQYVSQPRPYTPIDPDSVKTPVPYMVKIYDDAVKEVASRPTKEASTITSEALQVFDGSVPECITSLVAYREIRPDKTFNQVTSQVVTFLLRAGTPKTLADTTLEHLINNGKSTSYPSANAKRDHIRGVMGFVKNNAKWGFSCGAVKALLQKNPCDGCPLECKGGEGTAGKGKTDRLLGAIEHPDGYKIQRGEHPTLVSNFTLRPVEAIIHNPTDGTAPRRVATSMDVVQGESVVANLNLEESAFASRSAFLAAIRGLGNSNLTFQGSDVDVQKVMTTVFNSSREVGEVYQTFTCGLLVEDTEAGEVITYVEPGNSVNSAGVRDTHKFCGVAMAPPTFSTTQLPPTGAQEYDEFMFNLLNINDPVKLSVILGWFASNHYKSHIVKVANQYPILSVWGAASAGKSKTVELLATVGGIELGTKNRAVNISRISPFALAQYVSDMTTVPRIMEEYNHALMDRVNFARVTDVLKKAWNGEAELKGTMGHAVVSGVTTKGRAAAHTVEFPVIAPIVVMSEQEITTPALLDRSIRVQLYESSRKGRDKAFMYCLTRKAMLKGIGKALLLDAMHTSSAEVMDSIYEFDEWIPADMRDRPKFSYMVAAFGLSRLARVISEDLKLPRAADKMQELMDAFKANLSTSAESFYTKTEVDYVLIDMLTMIAISEASREVHGDNSRSWLQDGVHYTTYTDAQGMSTLLIDTETAIPIYVKYVSSELRKVPPINNKTQFLNLVRHEPYYLKEGAAPKGMGSLGRGRNLLHLSLLVMQSRGLNTEVLTGEVPAAAIKKTPSPSQSDSSGVFPND